ncbi:MAG TPA: type III pantothenate kinase [Gammaproteobacteria bacterium]|jgi:type III pantothenate kinase|nr:type III pantothenate kinase [Gammaproteobacteria bacterium]
MLLCLDIGNTHLLGGVYEKDKIIARFRYATHLIGTADQFGMFLLNILQVKGIQGEQIKAFAVSSVVPGCDFTIRHMISLYFKADVFMLRAGVKTGLNIKYKNPAEVGADIIAGAIGAMHFYPNQNVLVVDMGTATTVCVVTKNRDYLGGTILPGLRLGMESLRNNTAKLMEVDIEEPACYLGSSTRECIQSGLYYGQLGALKEIIVGMRNEALHGEDSIVIGTGGFAQLYKDRGLFDVILPDLVLQGLLKAYEYSV